MSVSPSVAATLRGSGRSWNWGTSSSTRTMGPATRCGKKLM